MELVVKSEVVGVPATGGEGEGEVWLLKDDECLCCLGKPVKKKLGGRRKSLDAEKEGHGAVRATEPVDRPLRGDGEHLPDHTFWGLYQ